MKIINATFARNHWFSLLKSVSNGTENPTAITSKNGDCVLISMEDWDHINKRYCAVCDCEEDYQKSHTPNAETRKELEESAKGLGLIECESIKDLFNKAGMEYAYNKAKKKILKRP